MDPCTHQSSQAGRPLMRDVRTGWAGRRRRGLLQGVRQVSWGDGIFCTEAGQHTPVTVPHVTDRLSTLKWWLLS